MQSTIPAAPPVVSVWAGCPEIKLEAKWLSPALQPFLADPNKRITSRSEFDAFIRREAPVCETTRSYHLLVIMMIETIVCWLCMQIII
jgi:hypothetical protein